MSGIRSWLWQKPLPAESNMLSVDQMERALEKERMRCDRYYQYFSLILIKFQSRDPNSHLPKLDRFLEERLRITDDRGWLRKEGFGVLLPMTNAYGAKVVERDILRFAKENQISMLSEVYTYEGHDGLEPKQQSMVADDSGDDLPSFFDSSDFQDPSRQIDASNSDESIGAESTGTSTKLRVDGPVRADKITQGTLARIDESRIAKISSASYPHWKRAMDISGAVVGLIGATPVIALSAIAIKLTSKGPVLFRQMRSGQYGRPFAIYKLRTMVVDAEELKHLLQERNERDGPAFKMAHDPRVTRVGRFLRKVGFDELPQLWNVLLGDMSLVGPRPLPVCEDAQCASWQRRRLDTKPGLTCTWQISKSRKMSFREWMRLDLQYASHRTVRRDLKLLIQTVGAVFRGRVGH